MWYMAIFGYLAIWVRQSWPSGVFLTPGPILDFILFKLALVNEANQLSILSIGHKSTRWLGKGLLGEQGAQWTARLKLAIVTKATNGPVLFLSIWSRSSGRNTPCGPNLQSRRLEITGFDCYWIVHDWTTTCVRLAAVIFQHRRSWIISSPQGGAVVLSVPEDSDNPFDQATLKNISSGIYKLWYVVVSN